MWFTKSFLLDVWKRVLQSLACYIRESKRILIRILWYYLRYFYNHYFSIMSRISQCQIDHRSNLYWLTMNSGFLLWVVVLLSPFTFLSFIEHDPCHCCTLLGILLCLKDRLRWWINDAADHGHCKFIGLNHLGHLKGC